MVRTLLSLLPLLLPFILSAQDDYFQQDVAYSIQVQLNDETHELTGDESIVYTNNSPDTLHFVWMHLWPNAYKDNTTALVKQQVNQGNMALYYADSIQRGFIDQLDFMVDNAPIKWEFHQDHIDIAKLLLNAPLPPKGSVTITTPFHVKIPGGQYSRLGHIGQSYQMTQWYPKPAVYDQKGWHPYPYLNQGEFYSEFGSYDVSITLPKNYVLGATGDRVNAKEEMKWLDQKVKETLNRKTFDSDMSFPASSKALKTIRFKQENVHDFAWFADKRYHVLKGEVELPHSKEKVTTWAMFTNAEANLWKRSIEYLNDAVYYYSLWNGDYPYKHCSAVDGSISAGGGMEYPNITVIGTSGTAISLETVIMHEVGHNWFYGILGSNEREHAWMDEGLNSFNENRYLETKYQVAPSGVGIPANLSKTFDLDHLDHKGIFEYGYWFNARRNQDQPIDYHSNDYTSTNYGAIVYGKTALVFDYMKAYLGEEKFDAIMQGYFQKWKFKHPQPEDLRKHFEQETGKDLTWFFDDLILTTKRLDYRIGSIKQNDKGYTVSVTNSGQINGPVPVSAFVGDSLVKTMWFEGFEGKKTLDFPITNADYFKIDGEGDLPEIRRLNNTVRTSGLFKRVEPLKLQLIGSLESDKKTQIFYSPIVSWNEQNKWMLGLALFNSTVPQKRFDYLFTPMYSFHSKSITGYADIGWNILPQRSRIFESIRLSTGGATFSNLNTEHATSTYYKLTPQLSIKFKKKKVSDKLEQFLTLRSVNLREQQTFYPFGQNGTVPEGGIESIDFNPRARFDEITYRLEHELPFSPYVLELGAQKGPDFTKGHIEIKYSHRISRSGDAIRLRLFGGYFFEQSERAIYNWQLTGQNATTDYTFDQVFLDRTVASSVLAQHFVDNHGGFKTPTLGGSSGDWLIAANLKLEVPISLPLGLFADLGFSPIGVVSNGTITTETQTLFDAGFYIPIIKNGFEIYFPLAFSKDIQDEFEFRDIDFAERIRFIFNINRFHPFKQLRNINP